ncbi:ORC-CDC6 family AAA ATPase [Chelatococcus reniformis]|uniref:Uncharacterized protein n=1 Tax=Chelatococcus reniformis TaxID=1494448 RepID=A0A916XGZ3_9HYPH|nr:DUF853 family protein [Chelatococcus reniformis]GGC71122.1 hypothetical protein GCM10010994_32030 [Chelatococcus reniformis]
MTESEALISVHRAFIGFNKRAEKVSDQILGATFVDSEPLYELLSTTNNQVIYGRRGTGKTHALKYLAQDVSKSGVKAVYIDLRSVGSNGSIYSDGNRQLAERASTLIVDVLQALLSEFYVIALHAIDTAPDPTQITIRLDDFATAIEGVKISGNVETEATSSQLGTRNYSAGLKIDPKEMSGNVNVGREISETYSGKRRETGREKVHLNFGRIGASLDGLIKVLGIDRLWVLVDEWSEVPVDVQPYLADLIRRTLLPAVQITVKIAAIEHRSSFSVLGDHGSYVGLELGADISADLNLDDFLVFDNNQQKATAFFKKLLFRHYEQSQGKNGLIKDPDAFMQAAFTQSPVFDEFTRAVEGVPRDALNLAAKIATKAFGQRIAMSHVRGAAKDWYQQDKQAAIKSNERLSGVLEKIVDQIIGERKARAFLFPSNIRASLIDQLFDSRVLHVLKRSISTNDEPGVRYDAYKIDYGCYVDLINTSKATIGLFEVDDEGFVEVPKDDYRSIRRAILRPADLEDDGSSAWGRPRS